MRRTWTCSAHESGRVSRWLPHPAGQDRHGLTEHEHARSGDVSHSARRTHHRTGDAWCIYPMYDYAHPLSDAIEEITHSICTLEFEDHRPLYDWFLEELGIFHSQQIEFARLNLTYTVMSKRKLLRLVQEGYVSGWDDPRMPTLAGLRRRGVPPEAVREFVKRIGVAKANSVVDVELLEHALREDLNELAPRVMAVVDPLKVIVDNYPEGEVDLLDVPSYPQDKSRTETRQVPFSQELYIERDDFMEDPPRKVLPPGTGARSAPDERLLRHLHRCGQEMTTADRRTALHL